MKFVVELEIFCLIVNFQLVKNQNTFYSNDTIYTQQGNETKTEEHSQKVHHNQNSENSPNGQKNDTAESGDNYTFLALIEIMFNDVSRKNCTGTIIHDNVVITAAHCFEMENSNSPQLELTGSFVIIGSQKMFDTGYEQYLPIERVLIHPDYKGWNADIALVYTYAGMMSDKPGNIIPLAEGNAFTSVYSNVTVLNWNQHKRNGASKSTKSYLGSGCSHSSEEKDTYFHKDITRPIYSKIYDWGKEDTESSTPKTNSYESTLTKVDYTILEINSCKNLVQKLKPAIYQIENVKSTLCYFTNNPSKMQANSGAPAIHRNHLVAISAGDLINDREHIIVATKLSCYCMWIKDNFPAGGEQLQCCTDCCTEMYFKSQQHIYY